MSDVKINVGMSGLTCALCAAEVAVDSPAYENLLAAVVCTACGTFGIYLGYVNVKTAIAKSKGPVKGTLKHTRQGLAGPAGGGN